MTPATIVPNRCISRPAVLLVMAMLLLAPIVGGCAADDTVYDLRDGAVAAGDAEYRFVIPPGSGEALDNGEPVDIMPNLMFVTVGETIEIVNDDSRGHLVGPYFIGPGETMRQRFSSPGRLEGVCTVHPTGEIVVVINEA